VPANSIVRITLRAEPDVHPSRFEGWIPEVEINAIYDKLVQEFNDQYSRFLEASVTKEVFTQTNKFGSMVQDMVRNAAALSLETSGSEVKFLPLHSTQYRDGVQMLSITGIVCNLDQIGLYQDKAKSIHFHNLNWDDPTQIDVPDLTIKERLHLESMLPIVTEENAGSILFDKLKYMIADTKKQSETMLSHYADCHRIYPNFVRILS
jgi:hypothetical protein